MARSEVFRLSLFWLPSDWASGENGCTKCKRRLTGIWILLLEPDPSYEYGRYLHKSFSSGSPGDVHVREVIRYSDYKTLPSN